MSRHSGEAVGEEQKGAGSGKMSSALSVLVVPTCSAPTERGTELRRNARAELVRRALSTQML